MSDDKKARRDLVAAAVHHKSIVILLCAVMMIAGVISLVFIPKDEFPQLDLPIGVVVGVYPGASELEVEQQLTRPLETFLWTFKEIDKERTSTISENGMSIAVVFLKSSDNNTEFWNKLKERLPLLRVQLPSGVLGLVANDDFGDVSAMLVTIESEQKTFREMSEYVDRLCDRLRTIPSLANIYRLGNQKEQIGVYLDRNRLPSYGVNTAMVFSKLSGQTGTMVTGSLDDGKLSRNLHIVPTLNTEQELAQTIIYSDPAEIGALRGHSRHQARVPHHEAIHQEQRQTVHTPLAPDDQRQQHRAVWQGRKGGPIRLQGHSAARGTDQHHLGPEPGG